LNLTAQSSSHGGNESSTDTGNTVNNIKTVEILANNQKENSYDQHEQESVKSYHDANSKDNIAIDLNVDIRLNSSNNDNDNVDFKKDCENKKCLVDVKSKPKISLKQLDNNKHFNEEITVVNLNKIITIESGRSSKIDKEGEKRKLVREEFLKMNIDGTKSQDIKENKESIINKDTKSFVDTNNKSDLTNEKIPFEIIDCNINDSKIKSNVLKQDIYDPNLASENKQTKEN